MLAEAEKAQVEKELEYKARRAVASLEGRRDSVYAVASRASGNDVHAMLPARTARSCSKARLCSTRPGMRSSPDTPRLTIWEVDDNYISSGLGRVMKFWFGQAIESGSFWERNCDEAGKELKYTNFMAAIDW